MLQELAIDALQESTPDAIDWMLKKTVVPRNLFNRFRILLPRTEVDNILIAVREEQCGIWVKNQDKTEEVYDKVSYNEDLPRILYRLKTDHLTFYGDFIFPKINFEWVNECGVVRLKDARNRPNIDMFLKKFDNLIMDFHSIIPVTADEVLNSMYAVSCFSYRSGVRAEESYLTKNTLITLAEKSHLDDGIYYIDIIHGKGVSQIEPQDVINFFRNAKFDEDTEEIDRHIHIKGVSGTREMFTDLLLEVGFLYKSTGNSYEIDINDYTTCVHLEFQNA